MNSVIWEARKFSDDLTLRAAYDGILALALALSAYALSQFRPQWFEHLGDMIRRLTERRRLCITLVFLIAPAIQCLLLPWMPIPTPHVHDEYVHLLAGETLASGRLANPTHPFWKHFETIYVLQQPFYAASYPPGQGFVLAFGQWMGNPWFGVCLSVGVMSAAVCWMLYGWLPPAWAAAGGLLCALRFGVCSYWMNSYWGGAVGAIGGALLFGSLVRLAHTERSRFAVLLTIGWAVVWFVRPYEAALLGIGLAMVLLVWLGASPRALLGSRARRVVLPAVGVVFATAAVTAYYNWRVTGDPLLLPYRLLQQAYGVPSAFYWQPAIPEKPFRYENLREVYYWQRDAYREGRSLSGFAAATRDKLAEFWKFYISLRFTIPVLLLPLSIRGRAMLPLAALCFLAAGASALYPFYYPHYSAAYVGVILLLILQSFRKMISWRLRGKPVGAIAAGALLIWNGLFGLRYIGPWMRKGTPISLENRGVNMLFSRTERSKVDEELRHMGGRHLVFVRYGPNHVFHEEWVFNAADIDRSPIVWARELDTGSDAALVKYFHDRSVWFVDADEPHPHLHRYGPRSTSTIRVAAAPGS
jgi:hypothetical protein